MKQNAANRARIQTCHLANNLLIQLRECLMRRECDRQPSAAGGEIRLCQRTVEGLTDRAKSTPRLADPIACSIYLGCIPGGAPRWLGQDRKE